ncbi:acetyl-CoA carboxylase biotin carboxylase subunit family protein [Streptomyces sp. NPDC085927]|uniref:acetyl-CoA carboxylase biotin carboxylase subunit family protein n=1 Tax=Streptomyces sp. NPDC085927 TaxID=3365738 RepID=UPI0037CE5A99
MGDNGAHNGVDGEPGADGVVLLIGCGMRRYREYLLAGAAATHPVWLFTGEEPDWQTPFLTGHTMVDVTDRAAVLAAAGELAGRVPVRGVLSWDETLIVTTAHVAEALGLPGAGVDGVEGCRDKFRSRRLLTAAGVDQPRYAWVDTAEEALAAAGTIGCPVVLKPRGMGASIGVVFAADLGEVAEAFRTADEAGRIGAVSYRGGALVEEYLEGPEISIDAAVVDGEYHPMFVARKQVGLFPYFEETGHHVAADDPLRTDGTLLETVRAAHRAIGYGYGITHTEVKLTARGPVIVEINGRLGGDLIPRLGQLATGIDPARAAVRAALGLRPDFSDTVHRTVGIRFGYPPEDCEVVSVTPPTEAEGLLAAEALVEPGAELRLPPNGYIARHSYVVVTGADRAQTDARLDAAAARVGLDRRPLSVPVPI